jgi:hypothetical protein
LWGLIVGIALGGLLLMVATTAWRDGELSFGELVLRRGEKRYTLAMAALATVGVALAGYSVMTAMRTESRPARTVDHERFTITLPGIYDTMDDLAEMLTGDGSMGALAYAGSGDELLITWATAPQKGTRAELPGRLKDPAIGYSQWKVDAGDQETIVDMEYRSPRGEVVARVIARQTEPDVVNMITAMCSHQGDPQRCRGAVQSLQLR